MTTLDDIQLFSPTKRPIPVNIRHKLSVYFAFKKKKKTHLNDIASYIHFFFSQILDSKRKNVSFISCKDCVLAYEIILMPAKVACVTLLIKLEVKGAPK